MSDKVKDWYNHIDLMVPKENQLHIVKITENAIISVNDINDRDDQSKWIIEPLNPPLTNLSIGTKKFKTITKIVIDDEQ